MGSLWTPDGEHEVPPPESTGPGAAAPGPGSTSSDPVPDPSGEPAGDASGDTLRAAAAAIGVDLDSLDEDERAQLRAELEEMMRVRREVAATPATEMLTNHLMRLFDLATIYLEGETPSFSDASTVIEAFRAMLDAVGDRLGESEELLQEALGQLQMLFVQAKEQRGEA